MNRINAIENKIAHLSLASQEKLPYKEDLRDFMAFQKYFFPFLEGQEFVISKPICREPHQIQLANLATRIINHDVERLIVNIPPSYGKTTWAVMLAAYGLAFYPRSRFIYISYSAGVAITQSTKIRCIVELRQYQQIFGVELSSHTRGKEFFITNHNGMVYAAGSEGTITSKHAGLAHIDEFGGCIFIDDFHKPNEVHSDTIRDRQNENFHKTIRSRLNNRKTPIIFIGQRLHEGDLPALLMGGQFDTHVWEKFILEALDPAGNALDPSKHTKEELMRLREINEYVYSAQYQQNPQPAGGGIFKRDKITVLDQIPDNIMSSFLTVDTSETARTHNDATAFSFWGLYKLKQNGKETNITALVWLDAWEIWVEPCDLENKFMQFYYQCARFHVEPKLIGIEKKSTGTTLLSTLQKLPGLTVIDTIPHRTTGKYQNAGNLKEDIKIAMSRANKIEGFLSCQSYVHSGRVTVMNNIFDTNGEELCINHLTKITANDTHIRDDLGDTMRDAINMGLMSDYVLNLSNHAQVQPVIKGYRGTLKRVRH
jgi:hypothetical protein